MGDATHVGGKRGYFAQSADLANSLLLILPLLLVYQTGLFLTRGATLNGADLVSVAILRQWGWDGLLVLNGVLIVAGIVGLVVLKEQRKFDPRIILPMAIESTCYALVLGLVITQVMARVGLRATAIDAWALLSAADGVPGGVLGRLCVALGAGVNEELVFRLGLMSGMIAALRKGGVEKAPAVAVAVLGSSLLFSLAHYLGPEQFAVYTFVYRFLAGVIFCALFAARGLGVVVYTHAIYDVLVLVVFARS
jgi:membrane protease YdiL (CAAX protease family)